VHGYKLIITGIILIIIGSLLLILAPLAMTPAKPSSSSHDVLSRSAEDGLPDFHSFVARRRM
jgi:hypothetical protein